MANDLVSSSGPLEGPIFKMKGAGPSLMSDPRTSATTTAIKKYPIRRCRAASYKVHYEDDEEWVSLSMSKLLN
jgi:hypothetical protein